MVIRLVEQIADAQSSQGTRGKERRLPGRAALAQTSSQRIHFAAATAEIVVSDGKVGGLDAGVNQKESLVLPVPVFVRGLREALGGTSRGEEENKTEDAEQSVRFHYSHAKGHGRTEGSSR